MTRSVYMLALVIGSSVVIAGITGFSINSIFPQTHPSISHALLSPGKSSDAPIAKDLVTVYVHDKSGNLKSQQTVNNIVTGAGAIFFCVQQGRCASEITVPAQAFVVAAPTYWIEFISGTANTNEPTGSDCTAPSGGGALAGDLVNARCNTVFGASGQYQAGGSVLTLGTVTGQLRNAGGTYNGTNSVFTVQTTKPTVCSIVNDGTAPSSSTCQFSETTVVLTNQSGGSLTVNGLALFSGTSTAVTGNLIIAETTITPVTLAAGDTISVTWTIIT